MAHDQLLKFLEQTGKDPTRLIFEDELTSLYNRRFLLSYFEYQVSWEELESSPLSLLMVDIDHFKQINDQHGHEAGDQALQQLAALIKEVAGGQGLAIRYAGDEFVLLLPKCGKRSACDVAERLLRRVQETPFKVDQAEHGIRLTLSIGVATTPEDARTRKTLLQRADTALYHVKKSGRNGVADAAALDPSKVFDVAALHKLEGATIAGRGVQLVQVAESFEKFRQGQNQFLLVRGAAGMGKSTLLDTVRRNLSQGDPCMVKVSGLSQELYRPYYLTTKILGSLLSQSPNQGADMIKTLDRAELRYLERTMPGIIGMEEPVTEDVPAPREDDRLERERLFTFLLHFISKILGARPLVLLVDDLQFADAGTLHVLRALLQRGDLPIFICATTTDIRQMGDPGEGAPLERFLDRWQRELGIQRIELTSLTAADIASHLHEIFPQLTLPESFIKDLARTSQGNPLFMSEVLRKLVLDQKVVLRGQQWALQPLEDGYLPRSLEEIIAQKMAALDEESRQLLAQASAFGEAVSLSFLAGSSETMEAKILQFVDQAVSQGLLSVDFDINDETIRFLGRQVQEIAYGSLDEHHRQELHQRIGNYQETLYHQRLLPSAATLAYHFKRSTDARKAGTYAQILAVQNQRLFDVQEAESYAGEVSEEEFSESVPLDPASLKLVPAVIRALLASVRTIKLYPADSPAIAASVGQARDTITRILDTAEQFSVSHSKGSVLVNGQPVELPELKSLVATFLDSLVLIELEGLAFIRDFTEVELRLLLEALAKGSRKVIDRGFWRRFVREHGLRKIKLRQVRYSERLEPEAEQVSVRVRETTFDRTDLVLVQDLLRALLGAARSVRLYPSSSQTVRRATQHLEEAVRHGVEKYPVLTLAKVEQSLLVNGESLDTTAFKSSTTAFFELLQSTGLGSLTFLSETSGQDLQNFLEGLKAPPKDGWSREYWQRFSEEQRITGILFDRHLYEVRERDPFTVIESEPEPEPEPEPLSRDPLEGLLARFPQEIKEQLLQGSKQKVRLLVQELFQGFADRVPLARQKIMAACQDAIDRLPLGFQHHVMDLLLDPLLKAAAEEAEPNLIRYVGVLLRRMARHFIEFAEYLLATRIFTVLSARGRNFEESRDWRADIFEEILKEALEASTLQILAEDLLSGEAGRQRSAIQVFGSLGHAAAPFLVDFIRQVDDLRARKLAAEVLAGIGPPAAQSLKRQLVLEVSAQGRLRILDVIDDVTKDLRTELVYALGDENRRVREAGFRLAERLEDDQLVDLLLQYARKGESDLAAGAIRCLGRLKSEKALKVLLSLLDPSTDSDRLVSCCRALGQIGNPEAIDPLAAILRPTKWYSLRKRWSPQVRSIAAFALGQIDHPRATGILAEYVNDPDSRVKRVARSRVRRRGEGP